MNQLTQIGGCQWGLVDYTTNMTSMLAKACISNKTHVTNLTVWKKVNILNGMSER